LEFESVDEIPSREIGIDEKGKTLMIMPWKHNYGFWTDNNLKLQDFTVGFDIRNITQEEFESRWKNFETQRGLAKACVLKGFGLRRLRGYLI
jgi:hypothetical protein